MGPRTAPAHGIPEIAGTLPHAQGPRVFSCFCRCLCCNSCREQGLSLTVVLFGFSLTRSLNHLDRGSHIILISISFFRWSLSVVSQNRVRMSYRSQLARFCSVLELGELKLCPQHAIVTMDSLGPVMLLSWVPCYSAYIRRYVYSTIR